MSERKRIVGRHYELARMYVRTKDAEFIKSHRADLLNGGARAIYEQLRHQDSGYPKTDNDLDVHFLRELFWQLSAAQEPIVLKNMGACSAVPTDWTERQRWPWTHRGHANCVELSLQVKLTDYQVGQVEQMIAIAEKKMHSYESDFFFHDMLSFPHWLGKKPILWIVGTSHTFQERHDSERDAQAYMAEGAEEHRANYLREDDTWVGAALRVACGKDDEFYYHDGAVLHRVSREKFAAIHERYVARVRELISEKLSQLKAA